MRSPVARRPLCRTVRRSLPPVFVAACATAAIAAPGAVAKGKWSAGATRVTAGSTYLALGDSVTFGYMEPGVVPAPDYHSAASFLAYPEQLGAELHLKVANAACPGETSASLIDASATEPRLRERLPHDLPPARVLQGLPARVCGQVPAPASQHQARLADDRRQRSVHV